MLYTAGIIEHVPAVTSELSLSERALLHDEWEGETIFPDVDVSSGTLDPVKSRSISAPDLGSLVGLYREAPRDTERRSVTFLK